MNTVRILVAGLFGFGGTVLIGFFTLITATLYHLLIGWWAPKRWYNPAEHMPHLWAHFLTEVGIRRIAGINIKVSGFVSVASENELVLCMANHPADIPLVALVDLITSRIHWHFISVVKREHMRNPFFGRALRQIGGAIPIDRGNATAAFGQIKEDMARIRAPAVLLILPDRRRPTPERISEDIIKYIGRIPGIERWLKHTLVPASGGLRTILLEQPNIRIVNATVGFVPSAPSGLGRFAKGTIHIELRTEHGLPKEEAALQTWLLEEWQRKHQLIDHWFYENHAAHLRPTLPTA
ncbi:MAG: hypothetical protein Q8P82_02705 [bacterium]|nr:hypothetical protein [bacterium]